MSAGEEVTYIYEPTFQMNINGTVGQYLIDLFQCDKAPAARRGPSKPTGMKMGDVKKCCKSAKILHNFQTLISRVF